MVRFGARAVLVVSLVPLAGCNIHTALPMQPNVPDVPPMEETDSPTGFNCFEAGSAIEDAACAHPTLAALDKRLASTLHARLREADIFGRDALLANQRVWLTGLASQCNLPPARTPGHAPDAATVSCLAQAYQAHTQAVTMWENPPALAVVEARAMGESIKFKTDMQKDPALCSVLAEKFVRYPTRDRGVDMTRIDGLTPIAGSHAGTADGGDAGQKIHVELYAANVFASYARRARSVSVNGNRLLDPLSLGQLIQAQNDNMGGRFSAFSSQTNDYGAIDVFGYQGRTLVLISDPWGFYTPAAAGESARAGVWELRGGTATPMCLYSTYLAPAVRDAQKDLPNFSAWRDELVSLREGDATGPEHLISETSRREQAQLRREAEWIVLNLPLLARAQANVGGWTPWLRKRHDAALDALAAWSDQSPANKAAFNEMFNKMRPAAQELLSSLQQNQGLDAAEAKDATALAMMELLYGATLNIAPSLGSDLDGPGAVAGYRARYPIIASPQG